MDESSSNTEASLHELPQNTLYSVEYPGYVSPGSIPTAIKHLGGDAVLNDAFKRTASKKEALLELNFRPDNAFSHPVPGNIVSTSNLVLKVVKRRYKRNATVPSEASGSQEPQGAYTANIIGTINRTARFRSQHDFFCFDN
jgi:general transcription factor 3C polypeptide 5 (transcription factor C subunit 1)